MTGQPGRPTSSVNPQPPAPPAPAAPPMQQNPNTSADSPSDGGPQQNGSAPQRAMTSPPSSVTPPFAGNRPPGAAGASSFGAQQTPVRGLPPDAPRLVISGAVYSPDPARRMLIVNGQVVREGADLGSGVVLEEVRPESAVLGFRGSRYNVFF
jgi:general secretion pathway protein B